jgi:hypothetical protein
MICQPPSKPLRAFSNDSPQQLPGYVRQLSGTSHVRSAAITNCPVSVRISAAPLEVDTIRSSESLRRFGIVGGGNIHRQEFGPVMSPRLQEESAGRVHGTKIGRSPKSGLSIRKHSPIEQRYERRKTYIESARVSTFSDFLKREYSEF